MKETHLCLVVSGLKFLANPLDLAIKPLVSNWQCPCEHLQERITPRAPADSDRPCPQHWIHTVVSLWHCTAVIFCRCTAVVSFCRPAVVSLCCCAVLTVVSMCHCTVVSLCRCVVVSLYGCIHPLGRARVRLRRAMSTECQRNVRLILLWCVRQHSVRNIQLRLDRHCKGLKNVWHTWAHPCCSIRGTLHISRVWHRIGNVHDVCAFTVLSLHQENWHLQFLECSSREMSPELSLIGQSRRICSFRSHLSTCALNMCSSILQEPCSGHTAQSTSWKNILSSHAHFCERNSDR